MSLKLFSSLFLLVVLVSVVIAHNTTEEVALRYTKIDMAYAAYGMKEGVYGAETLLHFLDSLDERGYTKENCVQTSNEDDTQHTVVCPSIPLYAFADDIHAKYSSQYFSNVVFSHQTQIIESKSFPKIVGRVIDAGCGYPGQEDADCDGIPDSEDDYVEPPCADNDADCDGVDDQEQLDNMFKELKEQEDEAGRRLIEEARRRSDDYARELAERDEEYYAQREQERQAEHQRIIDQLREEQELKEKIQLAQEDEAQQIIDEEQRMLAEKEERRQNNPHIVKDGKEYYPEVEKGFWGEKVVWKADDGSEMSSRQADKAIERGAEFVPAQDSVQIAKTY